LLNVVDIVDSSFLIEIMGLTLAVVMAVLYFYVLSSYALKMVPLTAALQCHLQTTNSRILRKHRSDRHGVAVVKINKHGVFPGGASQTTQLYFSKQYSWSFL